VRIIIKCLESDSPLRGRIHLRRLSLRPTSNLLQSGAGPYIINSYIYRRLCYVLFCAGCSFIAELRHMKVTSHIAQNDTSRRGVAMSESHAMRGIRSVKRNASESKKSLVG
jgi:hypothetical protein